MFKELEAQLSSALGFFSFLNLCEGLRRHLLEESAGLTSETSLDFTAFVSLKKKSVAGKNVQH